MESTNQNILIIGGTTEGRIAVDVCNEAAKPFYYSTKNASQQVESIYGIRLTGGLDKEEMKGFCREKNIRLIVDAAHPFAVNVHENIGGVASTLQIPVIRFERKESLDSPNIRRFEGYEDVLRFLEESNICYLLALTGVNSISKLKSFWQKHPCVFRIMRRRESLAEVDKQGFPLENIIFYDDGHDDGHLFAQLAPQAILVKESGESGGFSDKINTASELNIPVLSIRRPKLPYRSTVTVYGKYGLRKQIENLLPDFFALRTGYTTGSCATAATKAALTALLTGEQQSWSTITIPSDEPITIPIESTCFGSDGSATCTVVKDSGDDPDVTNGTEICATVALNSTHDGVRFLQGVGVGRVTLPGLGLEIGGPAINATPRMMMTREIQETLYRFLDDERIQGVDVTISVPEGEELAKKTFNPKLGIENGISIIGTSGIIKPFSSEAFVDSIRREIQVAKAIGVEHLVINSGAKSEKYLKQWFSELPPQAFVQYGNFIGECIKIADEEGIHHVSMGIMIGKAVKLAEGLLDTHSKKSVMNRDFLTALAMESQCSDATISQIAQMTFARELWNIIPPSESIFFSNLLARCMSVCVPLLPHGSLFVYLMDESGAFFSPPSP